MEKSNKRYKRIIALLALAALILAMCSGYCLLSIRTEASKMLHQREAERWQGDSSLRFTQIDCFLSVDEKVMVQDIYTFRYAMIEQFEKASVDAPDYKTIFTDAWSRKGKVKITGDKGTQEVWATAVGGNFFDFHPIQLVNGAFLKEDDFMKDRVLLDRETAWYVYGGQDLAGMYVTINGKPFLIAGVIEREKDEVSVRAYSDGMGIYMSFDAYAALTEDDGIDTYEVVMPNPVDGFARNVVSEKFPLGNGVAIETTNRYYIESLLTKVRDSSEMIVQNNAVRYPYWENAARITEAKCADLLRAAIVLGSYPMLFLLFALIVAYLRTKEKITEDVIPEVADRTEEFFRVRARRRIEKKYRREHGKDM